MTDHKIDEQLNRLSRAIADTSPEPPAIRSGSAGDQHPRRVAALVWGFALALAIGLVGSITIFLTGGPTAERSPTNEAPPSVTSREFDVVIWLESGLDDDALHSFALEAMTWEHVVFADPWNQARTATEFGELFADLPEIVEALDPDFLPTSVRVWLDDPAATADVIAHAESLGLTAQALPEGPALDPVELGTGHVWPEEPRPGTPIDLAVAFGSEVLGWNGAVCTEDPPGDPTGPVWVECDHPFAVEALRALTSPLGDKGWVLMQVGTRFISGGPTIGVDETGGQAPVIHIVALTGAHAAEVTIHLANGDHVTSAITYDSTGATIVFPAVDPMDIRTVLVRYLDRDDRVVGAVGGHYTSPTEPGPRFCTVSEELERLGDPFSLPPDQARPIAEEFLALMIDARDTAPQEIRSQVTDIAQAYIDLYPSYQAAGFDSSKIDEATIDYLFMSEEDRIQVLGIDEIPIEQWLLANCNPSG